MIAPFSLEQPDAFPVDTHVGRSLARHWFPRPRGDRPPAGLRRQLLAPVSPRGRG